MASMLQVLYLVKHIFFRNLKRTILTGLSGLVFVIVAICGYGWLSYLAFQAKGCHELYFRGEFTRLNKLVIPPWRDATDPAVRERYAQPPYNQRINPAIHDIPQLWSENIEGQLSLHENGTGMYPAQRYWIYLAGTAAEAPIPWWRPRAYIKSMLNHSSHDPPEIAKAYNEAMNQFTEYLHNEGKNEDRIWPMYRFGDCDRARSLCDLFWVDPPVLVYLEVKSPCRFEMDTFQQVCSVSASVVGLPLQQLPYRPTQTIGGNVVPVFPSPFEELKMMMTSVDTIDAIGLEGSSLRYVMIDRQNAEDDEYGYPILFYESFLQPRWETVILGLGRLLGYV